MVPALGFASDTASNGSRLAIYDAKADGEHQIAKALKQAQRQGKRVLLVFGANWCSDCHAMHQLFKTHRGIAATLKAGYVVVMIDVDSKHGPMRNAATVERFGNPLEGGIPALVVLAADGAQITPRKTRELADTDHRHPEKVLAFVKKWSGSSVK